jgi:hypothetical protein
MGNTGGSRQKILLIDDNEKEYKYFENEKDIQAGRKLDP